jgi:hypothetical protein
MAEPPAPCSFCKAPIPLGARYYRCSITTCNSGRMKLRFCSLACWDGHLPTARHRDAAALEDVWRPPLKRRR